MSRKVSPEHRLAGQYRRAFSEDHAKAVLADLVDFAQQELKDPAVRCGRMDVIARILRQSGKGNMPATAPTPYEEQEGFE